MLPFTCADQLNASLAGDCPHLEEWSENPQRYWGYYSATLQLKDGFTLKQFRDLGDDPTNGFVWDFSSEKPVQVPSRKSA